MAWNVARTAKNFPQYFSSVFQYENRNILKYRWSLVFWEIELNWVYTWTNISQWGMKTSFPSELRFLICPLADICSCVNYKLALFWSISHKTRFLTLCSFSSHVKVSLFKNLWTVALESKSYVQILVVAIQVLCFNLNYLFYCFVLKMN